MDADRGLQEVVSRNVRVLMAVHDITHQKELAALLNWGADKLTRTLNGSRRWALEDLPALADVFGVTPAALLSDTAELVGAAGPARAASHGVTHGVTHEYRSGNDAQIIPFPRRTRPSHPRRGYPANGVAAPSNWHNERAAITVTARVGT